MTINHISFDSKAEADYYLLLLAKQQAGEIKSFRTQPKYLLQERFSKDGHTIRPIEYIADFEIEYADGRVEVVDVKGMETEGFKIKRKLFDYRYPHLKLTRMRFVKKFGGWITHEEWIKEKRKEEKK